MNGKTILNLAVYQKLSLNDKTDLEIKNDVFNDVIGCVTQFHGECLTFDGIRYIVFRNYQNRNDFVLYVRRMFENS